MAFAVTSRLIVKLPKSTTLKVQSCSGTLLNPKTFTNKANNYIKIFSKNRDYAGK